MTAGEHHDGGRAGQWVKWETASAGLSFQPRRQITLRKSICGADGSVQREEELVVYFWSLPKQDDFLIYAQLAFN